MVKALLVLALAAAAAVAYTHRDWMLYERLSRHGVMTQGWVTGKSDSKQRKIYYAFRTDVKMFTDTGTGGYGNPTFDQVSEGDYVLVYYLPSDPDVSCLGDPTDRVRRQNIILISVLLPALAFGAWALAHELRSHNLRN